MGLIERVTLETKSDGTQFAKFSTGKDLPVEYLTNEEKQPDGEYPVHYFEQAKPYSNNSKNDNSDLQNLRDTGGHLTAYQGLPPLFFRDEYKKIKR